MTRPRSALIAIPIGLALLTPAPLHADVGGHVDADLEVGSPVGLDTRAYALGAGARFGWRFDLGPVWLQPEIGGSYVAFPGKDSIWRTSTTYEAARAARATGGLRLGGAGLLARVIEPALFGHAGYGWVVEGFDDYPRHGPAFDVGFAVDLKLARHLSLGLQGAFNLVTSPPTPDVVSGPSGKVTVRWLSYGVHAGASF